VGRLQVLDIMAGRAEFVRCGDRETLVVGGVGVMTGQAGLRDRVVGGLEIRLGSRGEIVVTHHAQRRLFVQKRDLCPGFGGGDVVARGAIIGRRSVYERSVGQKILVAGRAR
jgi:hypothetical protein